MEILFISHKYPPSIGGMQKQCYELIEHAKKNHIVHQIVHTGEAESKFSFFKNLKRRVKKILAQHPNIDVIHLNDGLMGLFTLWLKKYTNIPVVITFHGLDLVFPNSFYQKMITRRMVKYDGAISVSTATAEESLKRGFTQDQVFTVPNGVDRQIADFKPNAEKFIQQFSKKFGVNLNGKKVIATLGRPVQRKGFSWFLENVVPNLADDVVVLMMGPLAAKGETWWRKMIPKSVKDQIDLATGGLSDEAKIQVLLQRPEIQQKVIQTNKLPFSDVLEVLSLAHLFVMPNVKKWGDAEGFGLVALEATLRKAVVLASDLEGIPEAIQDGKNGFLLPSDDKATWIKKVNELLEKPQELKTLGEKFQQFTLDNYSWEKMAEGYIEVFEKIKKIPSNYSKENLEVEISNT